MRRGSVGWWCVVLLFGGFGGRAAASAPGWTRDARAAVAGGLAGTVTNGVLHPLDTAKTLRQRSPAQFSSVFDALATTTKQRGFGSLYHGMWPAAVGAFPSSALYFGAYETMKRRLTAAARGWNARAGRDATGPLRTKQRLTVHVLAAASGNALSSIVFVPKEFLKQRLQLAAAGNAAKQSALGVLASTVRDRGVGAMYAGYFATLARNIPSAAIRFTAYEELKLMFHVQHAGLASALAGGLAGMTASGLMTPMDVVKTKLATGALSRELNLVQCLQRVVAEQGVLGLYSGVQGRLIQSALFSAIGFGAFEYAKDCLGVNALDQLAATTPANPVAAS